SVLRAWIDTPKGPVELSGSPQYLSQERYRRLEQLQRRSTGGPAAGLHGLAGPLVHGWAEPGRVLELLLDGQACLALRADAQGQLHGVLPAEACDGRPHQLELRDGRGCSLDERIVMTPFQLTPWPALLEHSRPPFPDQLHPLVLEQHRSLTTWLHWAASGEMELPPQLPRLHQLLAHGREPEEAVVPLDPPVQLPCSPSPEVSVVIPAHNHYGVTRRCLLAIAYAASRVAMELIVVDDASSDGTCEALARDLRGFRLVRHGRNRGFNQACHSGVAEARAPYVVLLNNDTEPCARWLEELLAPFERWPDTGITGAQLLFADGRLQEAGGIVWGDGQPWNYGRGGNPYDPRVSYTRQVDYVSGACLAIPTALWHELGGFSAEFAPAYFEDTDLAFAARARQRRVRYAPLARVIHHEGTSCGIDTGNPHSSKRLQLLHGPLFRRKWQHALTPSGPPSAAAAERRRSGSCRPSQLWRPRTAVAALVLLDLTLVLVLAGGDQGVERSRMAQISGELHQMLPQGPLVVTEGFAGKAAADQLLGDLAKRGAVQGFELLGLDIEPHLGHLAAPEAEVTNDLGIRRLELIELDQPVDAAQKVGITDQGHAGDPGDRSQGRQRGGQGWGGLELGRGAGRLGAQTRFTAFGIQGQQPARQVPQWVVHLHHLAIEVGQQGQEHIDAAMPGKTKLQLGRELSLPGGFRRIERQGRQHTSEQVSIHRTDGAGKEGLQRIDRCREPEAGQAAAGRTGRLQAAGAGPLLQLATDRLEAGDRPGRQLQRLPLGTGLVVARALRTLLKLQGGVAQRPRAAPTSGAIGAWTSAQPARGTL
ncbi:MAG: glycosyltransferase family 2 protein, partial [Cyanobacteria bacterium K_DeepCast_35m_m2_023]|nr:glycosyltransferase family 2 protein [Cyanobacteria bacterium K_DeepCast_35m_m2_023]